MTRKRGKLGGNVLLFALVFIRSRVRVHELYNIDRARPFRTLPQKRGYHARTAVSTASPGRRYEKALQEVPYSLETTFLDAAEHDVEAVLTTEVFAPSSALSRKQVRNVNAIEQSRENVLFDMYTGSVGSHARRHRLIERRGECRR